MNEPRYPVVITVSDSEMDSLAPSFGWGYDAKRFNSYGHGRCVVIRESTRRKYTDPNQPVLRMIECMRKPVYNKRSS